MDIPSTAKRAGREAWFVFACDESRRRCRRRRKRGGCSPHSSRTPRRAPPSAALFLRQHLRSKDARLKAHARARHALERAFCHSRDSRCFFILPLSLSLSLSVDARETQSNSRERETRARRERDDELGAVREPFSLDGLEQSSTLCAVAPVPSSARLSLSLSGRTRDSIQLSRESRERRQARAPPCVFFGTGSSERFARSRSACLGSMPALWSACRVRGACSASAKAFLFSKKQLESFIHPTK
jgi:hypothetical protein